MKTDEQVNDLAWECAISQYGNQDHEEVPSTVNGFIMGYNEAKKDLYKWISIEERLPELNTDVQVSDGQQVKFAWFGKRTKTEDAWFRFTLLKVTHWLPLLDPPK